MPVSVNRIEKDDDLWTGHQKHMNELYLDVTRELRLQFEKGAYWEQFVFGIVCSFLKLGVYFLDLCRDFLDEYKSRRWIK